MNNKKNNLISIMTQAFYGNRTRTKINKENIDRFVLGYIDDSITVTESIDRTIINVPNTNNVVIVYNKYQEEDKLQKKEALLKEENYAMKPLVVIPELNIKLYSRCIVCRMDENGEFQSLQEEDFDKFINYLAE